MVTDVQDEAGEQTTADIRDTGADALYVHLDEAGWQAVDRVVVYEDVEPAALGEHAAKGSVRTLTKNATLHWATEGVRLNSVHPGFIRTPILEQAKGTEVWDSMTAMTPMGRLGEPHAIAAAVAYLASDDASFVTGLELYVDGGYIAR